ncbi:MAG: hypothetical protein AAB710_00565, partial [Patescibacteria group bacterium]
IYATTTGKSLFVRGNLSATSTQDLFEVAGDATIHDILTLTTLYATNTVSALDFYATSSSGSFYASSTIQAGGTIIGYGLLDVRGTGTSSFRDQLAVIDAFAVGGTSSTTIRGNGATSTFTGPVYISTGTSTIAAGLRINGGGLNINLPSCTSELETDSNGAVVCGTSTGGSPNVAYTKFGTTKYYTASTTASDDLAWYFGNGFIGSASSTVAGNLGIGTSTAWATLSVEQNGVTPLIGVGDNGTSTPFFKIGPKGLTSLGTSTPNRYAFLTIDRMGSVASTTPLKSSTTPITYGIEEEIRVVPTGAGTHVGNRMFIINAPTNHYNTVVGELIKINDASSFANTVRGIEVQTNRGANTQGENTAIAAFGRTFGVRGVTEGDAGGTFEPAGLMGETRGTTQGNAIRGYSASLTSGTLMSLYQEDSAMTGAGLLMNLGNDTGSFTGDFFNLQNRGKEVWAIGPTGSTTIGTSTASFVWTLTVQGGVCVTAGAHCAATELNGGIAVDVNGAGGGTVTAFDVAERYAASEVMEAGDIAMMDTGTSSIAVMKAQASTTSPILVGVVSTHAAIALNGSNVVLAPAVEATSTNPLVALAGRVPVKVSNENGEVQKGDYITASSQPGVGRKANDGERTIGIALEDFTHAATTTNTEIRKVLTFINLGHAKLDHEIANGSLDAASSTMDQFTGAFEPLEGSLNLSGKDIVNVRGILSEGNVWNITPEGTLAVTRVETNELYVKDKAEVGATDAPRGVTLYDANGSGQPYCFYILDGKPSTVSGTCEANKHLFENPSFQPKTPDPTPSEDPVPADNNQDTSTSTDSLPVE